MSTEIHRNDDEAFNDNSEESEKKIECFIIQKLLRPVPNQGLIEQAKKKWRMKTPTS